MATTPVNPVLNATAALRMSDEQFQKHRAAEVARRSEFATMYPDVAKAVDTVIQSQLPPGTNPSEVIVPTVGRNEEEDEKLSEVRKVHKRMAEIGTVPATIANLHPWPVQGTGRYLMYADMTVPACPIGQPYQLTVVRHYKVDIEDKGGRFGADVITPISLAKDILKQLEAQKRGGLFAYMGDHLPGERQKSKHDEMSAWDKAKREQLKFYRQLYREAEGFFQQTSRVGIRNIGDLHRLSCQWLLHYRYVTVVPAWLTATREEGDVPDNCPKCGSEVVAGGFSCGNCAYVVDPYLAFQQGEIEDEHHSLRRLSREKLDELGLDYIPTMEEFRAFRREKAHGKPEPPTVTDPPVATGEGQQASGDEVEGEDAALDTVDDGEDDDPGTASEPETATATNRKKNKNRR